MRNVKRAQDLIGSDVYDREGDKIGRVGNVYVDDSTHQPEWVTVRTGMFGTRESFVPLAGASASDDGISVGVSKEMVKDAPRVDIEHGHLSDHEGQNLYSYYGLQRPSTKQPQQPPQQQQPARTEQPTPPAGSAAPSPATSTPGSAASDKTQETDKTQEIPAPQRAAAPANTTAQQPPGQAMGAAKQPPAKEASDREPQHASPEGQDGAPTAAHRRTETADVPPQQSRVSSAAPQQGPQSMTRSEERLLVATENVEAGRVRLRKYIVTEKETVSIALRREEVRIERELISESERSKLPASSSEIGEASKEIILHAERPVISKETVPVERIRLNTEMVTEEQTIESDVRKEQFDIQDSSDGHHRAAEEESTKS